MISTTWWPHIKFNIIIFQFLSASFCCWAAPCTGCSRFSRNPSWVNFVARAGCIHWTHADLVRYTTISFECRKNTFYVFFALLLLRITQEKKEFLSATLNSSQKYEFPYFHGFGRHFEISRFPKHHGRAGCLGLWEIQYGGWHVYTALPKWKGFLSIWSGWRQCQMENDFSDPRWISWR